MSVNYNLPVPDGGLQFDWSGRDPAGITLAVESGWLHVEALIGTQVLDFIIPPRRSWTTLPGMRLGISRLRLSPDAAHPSDPPVVTYDVGPEAGSVNLGGLAGETSLYEATPGDGTWTAAPAAASADTFTPSFPVAGFTMFVKTAEVSIRCSFDGGSTFSEWMTLLPGVTAFDQWAVSDIEIRAAVDGNGGEYQITVTG